ncbi:hypothetical protein HS088_TW01G00286 [Tripterygium wilfordii]|uniref:Transcription initiation factor IIA gamma subunit N-terminal domain-containing protein n=1 Tax=Tripterygium wilfordii TaxID=458696 RepID=A0A7J7E1B7_TRIWF|nr:hypothetical protein HS088_TW01G00286 [Tripterygium wilfordii]
MATFELYRRSTIGMCLTETLDEMVQSDLALSFFSIAILFLNLGVDNDSSPLTASSAEDIHLFGLDSFFACKW